MNERDTSPIGFFQKYLTVWVILCMAVGICIGKFLPQIPELFESVRVCTGVDSNGDPHLGDDLSHDDEGRLP